MKSSDDIVSLIMNEDLPDNHDELILINKQLYDEREKLNEIISTISDDFNREHKKILKQNRDEYNASMQCKKNTNELINRYNNITMLIEAVEKKLIKP